MVRNHPGRSDRVALRIGLLVAGVAGVLLSAVSRGSEACDPRPGQEVFAARCALCHSRDEGRHLTGPSLHSIANRPAGKASGFAYSGVLASSAVTWDAAALDAFIRAPQSFMPGTVMPFGGLRNDSDRAALVCYLMSDLP